MRTTQSQCVMRGQAETMLMGSDDHTYNGWRNYETWTIVSWIDNEQYYAANIARIVLATDTTSTGRHSASVIVGVADSFKDFFEDELYVDDLHRDITLNPMAQQLLYAAFGDVDWVAISKHYLETPRDELYPEEF